MPDTTLQAAPSPAPLTTFSEDEILFRDNPVSLPLAIKRYRFCSPFLRHAAPGNADQFLNALCRRFASRYGAKGDGHTLDTAAIQRAIDAAAKGGGTVVFHPGAYLTGSIFVKWT